MRNARTRNDEGDTARANLSGGDGELAAPLGSLQTEAMWNNFARAHAHPHYVNYISIGAIPALPPAPPTCAPPAPPGAPLPFALGTAAGLGSTPEVGTPGAVAPAATPGAGAVCVRANGCSAAERAMNPEPGTPAAVAGAAALAAGGAGGVSSGSG